MKIKCPRFVLKMTAKYVSKLILEEAGIKNNIVIYDFSIDTKGENCRMSVGGWIDVDKKDLKRFIKESMNEES